MMKKLSLFIFFLCCYQPSAFSEEQSSQPTSNPLSHARRWLVYAVLTNSYDTNISHDEADTDSYGLVYGAGMQWQNSVADPVFLFKYEAAKHSYANTQQWDRISQTLDTTYKLRFNKKLVLDFDAIASFKGSSEDREIDDQYTFNPQLKFKLDKNNKFEIYAAYRLKRYEPDQVDRNATNKYVGFIYERRVFFKNEIAFEYRYEENKADGPRYDYYRRRYAITYTIPFRSRDWIQAEFKYRDQRYLNRTVDIPVENGPDRAILRKDDRYNFNIEVAISITNNIQLLPGYTFETRRSTDVNKEFKSHYPAFTILYRWQ